ncbi:MAG: hypothetical protein ABMA13_21690 [Chthoniobacteraceae bacterium]
MSITAIVENDTIKLPVHVPDGTRVEITLCPGGGEHHELDALIGSWREDPGFDAAIRAFEQVDEAMWK